MFSKKNIIKMLGILSLSHNLNVGAMELPDQESEDRRSDKEYAPQDTTPNKKRKKSQENELEAQEESEDKGLSPQERWYKHAEKVAQTWGQSLEEFTQEAVEFLNEYRKVYPNHSFPGSITDLMILEQPDISGLEATIERYNKEHPDNPPVTLQDFNFLPPPKFGVPI